jgi:diacylglycerol kinase (ATP)
MDMKPVKPKQTTGPAHVIAAFGYSLAGLRCLWKEAAFRLELLGGALGLGILMVAGASISRTLLFVLLLLCLLAIEALNTAIELIVDRISPEWSEFGKKTKDVASAAVFITVIANIIYFSATLFEVLYF